MPNPNPTNVNVPPTLAADPTNINVPIHGTKFPSGVTGADFYFELAQKSDLGNGVTAVIADSYTAPCRLFIRAAGQMNYSLAATMSYSVSNSTQSADIIASVTPTTNTAAAATVVTAQRLVEKGDVLQLLVTTSGGGGACKGLSVKFFATELEGSVTIPV